MEREVVLTLRNNEYNKKKVDNEISTIKKMLPFIESFETFCDSNEVFDANKNTIIKNRQKLLGIHKYGLNENMLVYVVSKN